MSPSRPFILRPVATSLLMVALMLSGIIAYRLLPVSALPQVDFPTIQVFTFYPGASPAVTASAITAPSTARSRSWSPAIPSSPSRPRARRWTACGRSWGG